jgi:hypothetical protein
MIDMRRDVGLDSICLHISFFNTRDTNHDILKKVLLEVLSHHYILSRMALYKQPISLKKPHVYQTIMCRVVTSKKKLDMTTLLYAKSRDIYSQNKDLDTIVM